MIAGPGSVFDTLCDECERVGMWVGIRALKLAKTSVHKPQLRIVVYRGENPIVAASQDKDGHPNLDVLALELYKILEERGIIGEQPEPA